MGDRPIFLTAPLLGERFASVSLIVIASRDPMKSLKDVVCSEHDFSQEEILVSLSD